MKNKSLFAILLGILLLESSACCLPPKIDSRIPAMTDECVILLHGLARSARAMQKLTDHLAAQGYHTLNVDYPSTRHRVETLVEDYLVPARRQCEASGARKIHFVGHSMGNILVRYHLQTNNLPAGSRVVMLGPPNHGSEIVDYFGDWRLFQWHNGPAGSQLGTAPDSLPNRLAPVEAEIGIIAGTRNREPWFRWLFDGPNDGKVTVASTRLKEMRGFITLPATHTWMMCHPQVMMQTAHFLKHGKYK